MKIERRYTKEGQSPYAEIAFRKATSEIRNPDGSIVFRLENIDVPAQFSQVASDILAQKYFRKAGDEKSGSEMDAKQVFDRLAGTWAYWGWKGGYFDTEKDASAFYDELRFMLATQKVAPNSPQWFNTGLHWAYGIDGPSQGHHYVDYQTGKLVKSKTAYEHPQPHACFIQSVEDDLVNENGIMDLWVREARLFKYGSGTGSNFSLLRGSGENLSGGGRSSGLMSFLKIGDRAAGAIKSGGTTRRAAKMVVVDIDHPDIEDYINWKVKEEQKVAALVTGSKDTDWDSEAYLTVSGQNSNNSVRVTDGFLNAVEGDGDWDLIGRIRGDVTKTVKARDLWEKVGYAAWASADPGIQYHTTINDWHTCPAAGDIRASNPCSEYMFLDDTACNLASLNLMQFRSEDRSFDVENFEHATRLWTIVLEVSVLMAQFPSKQIAKLSYEYRTLGLGYANIGGYLMTSGIPYDSDEGRAICGAITAIMTGVCYATSAEMAREQGPFPSYAPNADSMLRVIRNHRLAAHGKAAACEDKSLIKHAEMAWDKALKLGEKHGYRNAQVSV
ncbi:UNVERIFIED_CONTAM: hypothetical protein GTU68_056816, partial [Idotea baltica]|nr:hypothetical protein [Idotea baltica]